MSTVVYYPASETPLDAETLAHTLGSAMEASAPLHHALRQLLAERLARATVEAAQPDLTERAAGHAAGRLAELLSLQHQLANCLAKARELAAPTDTPAGRRARARR